MGESRTLEAMTDPQNWAETARELAEKWYLHTKHSKIGGGYDYPEVGGEVEQFLHDKLLAAEKAGAERAIADFLILNKQLKAARESKGADT